ncbi:MAG: M20/M25/M40 family metallo-hydrolase [Clostridia bacterium]|nr:M20/M25/M40 family metallo-hydrolase [Clostridia bacterium]
MAFLNAYQLDWCERHAQEAIALLKDLGKIPAPSHHEEKRAEFVKNWLENQGAKQVYIDSALNVIYPIGVTEDNPLVVLMAHTDIVFPDTQELAMREEDDKLFAPGIGDDTANLVTLLMAAKYAAEHEIKTDIGVLIVANSCEEGLGNLKGSKQIFKDFEGRIVEMISIDGGLHKVVNTAVGSHRMKVTIRAQGGHSYGKFGNTNAIVQMAHLIGKLYEKQVPTKAKTTYNVGVIEGGTTVNSICGECSMLYEYRSEDRECLAEMEAFFNETVEAERREGVNIDVEILGIRPCNGDVDAEKLNDLTRRMQKIMHAYTGNEITACAGSTDANTALALGIPSVTIGAMDGALGHTRGEWVRLSSILPGQKIALAVLLHYFD